MELSNFIQSHWIDLILYASAGGVISYCLNMWWQDERELRQKEQERQLHQRLLTDDYMSIDEINKTLDKLENNQ